MQHAVIIEGIPTRWNAIAIIAACCMQKLWYKCSHSSNTLRLELQAWNRQTAALLNAVPLLWKSDLITRKNMQSYGPTVLITHRH